MSLTEGLRLAEEAGASGTGDACTLHKLDPPPCIGNILWQSPTRTNRSIALLTLCCCAGCAHVSQMRRFCLKCRVPSSSHRGISLVTKAILNVARRPRTQHT